MDVQLEELIEKIKKDGISTAEQEASRIVSEAEDKARSILETARKESESILEQAQTNATRTRASSETALKQASRDLLLAVKARLETLFEQVVQVDTAVAYQEILQDAIVKVVGDWQQDDLDIRVLIGDEPYARLGDGLKKALAEKLKAGVEIKPVPGVDSGFKIEEKDGSAFYDFSEASIARMIAAYVNKDLAALIDASLEE